MRPSRAAALIVGIFAAAGAAIALAPRATVEPAASTAVTAFETQDSAPAVMVIAAANLMKPFLRLILPKEVRLPAGNTVATVTDALYCDMRDGSAVIIAQITKAGVTEFAPHLVASDCMASPDQISVRHAGAAGFSGALVVAASWTPWRLAIRTRQVATVPAAFSEAEVAALRAYAAEVGTESIPLDSGGVHERYALAVKFGRGRVTLGFFEIATAPVPDWAGDSDPPSQTSTRRTNVHVYLSHAAISRMLAKYPTLITYAVPGTGFTATGFTYAVGPDQSVEVAAKVSGEGGVTVRLVSHWSGAPLRNRGLTATPDPSTPLTMAFAEAMRKSFEGALKPTAVLPTIEHDVAIGFGGQKGAFAFSTELSSAWPRYLLLSGNGGLDLAN